MGYFPSTIAAYLAGRVIQRGILVHFDFLGEPHRVWSGTGLLRAGGREWSGLGELGTIEGLESALGGIAPETTFTLSGVDPTLVLLALNSSDRVKGRSVTVFLQLFDLDSLETLDDPFAIYLGTMDVMKVSATGPTMRKVSVTAETLFARRALAPWEYLSDRDQNRLFPGDRGLEMVPSMANKSVEWPPPFNT